jgi:transposase
MLSIGPTTKIFLVTGATDMRKAYDTLAAIVVNKLDEDPCSGSVFVFCNRGRNRVKILVWDRAGFWLVARRLERGTFAWPESPEKSIHMSPEELTLLLCGIDLRGAVRRRWYERPAAKKQKTFVESR